MATWANYSQPLGSVSKGTLRRTGPTDLATIDLPDDDFGRAVRSPRSESDRGGRAPLPGPCGQRWGKIVDETMVYTKPVIRAFVVSATDKREGWPDPDDDRHPRH